MRDLLILILTSIMVINIYQYYKLRKIEREYNEFNKEFLSRIVEDFE